MDKHSKCIYNLTTFHHYLQYHPLNQQQCFVLVLVLVLVLVFRATPVAYVSSQARGQIGATASGLGHNNSIVEPELCLWHIPQLTEMPDP